MAENGQNTPWWEPALKVFGQITGLIAGPVIAALFLGRWLDEKFDTEPIIFISLTILALVFSTASIIRISTRYMKEIETNDQNSHGDTKRNK